MAMLHISVLLATSFLAPATRSFNRQHMPSRFGKIPCRDPSVANLQVSRRADVDEDALGEEEARSLLAVSDQEDIYDLDLSCLSLGLSEGHYITERYLVPSHFNLSSQIFDGIDVERLALQSENVTLPVALMVLDPDEYPTMSRARKAVRKGHILIQRCCQQSSLSEDNASDNNAKFIRGRVAHRIYPRDSICKQARLSHGVYSTFLGQKRPPFDLPVVYEDDFFAIVNKPAGVVVYDDANCVNEDGSTRRGHGRNTIRFALPYVLTPPKRRSYDGDCSDGNLPLIRPVTCHRLDKPTSGLLVVAKTREAAVDLSRQFEERLVQKTYTAITHGSPVESNNSSISSRKAYDLGLAVDPDSSVPWQIVHDSQEGKEALTVWRTLRQCRSLKAKDGCVTLVEMKPKTGRKHQLRRHMAWVYDCPLVGDTTYGTSHEAKRWGRGLMLCSNRVRLLHPYYNTLEGRKQWEKLDKEEKYSNGMLHFSDDGKVVVTASISLPDKFETFLSSEEKRTSYV